MRITDIAVFILEAGYLQSKIFQQKLATPMSPFPEFAANRSLWMWPPEKVVTILTDEAGNKGISITNGGRVVATIIHDQLARLLRDRSSGDIDTAWEIMFRSLLPFDRSGFAMMAVSGVDLALWDLKCKQAQRPLLDLLGGSSGRRLSTYVTTLVPERYAGSPHRGIKVPIVAGPSDGEDGIQANIDLVRRAREAAGTDGDVMIDAFMGWDVDYTVRMFEAFAPYRVRWFEDPISPTDVHAFEELKRRCGDGLQLALGNFCFSRWDCAALLELGVVSILQPDIAWCGGLTEALRIRDMARAAGVPIIFHNTSEQPWALALSQASPEIVEVEYVDRDPGSMLHQMFEGGSRVVDGTVEDAGSPGCEFSDRVRSNLIQF